MDAAKTIQQIDTAKYALTSLEAELREPTKLFTKLTLTAAKAKLPLVALDKYLADHGRLDRVIADKGFAALPEAVQARAIWLVALSARLKELQKKLAKAWKIAKAGPIGNEAAILKLNKSFIPELRTPPKMLARLAKKMQLGEKPAAEQAPLIAMLPLAILTWAIADVIEISVGK